MLSYNNLLFGTSQSHARMTYATPTATNITPLSQRDSSPEAFMNNRSKTPHYIPRATFGNNNLINSAGHNSTTLRTSFFHQGDPQVTGLVNNQDFDNSQIFRGGSFHPNFQVPANLGSSSIGPGSVHQTQINIPNACFFDRSLIECRSPMNELGRTTLYTDNSKIPTPYTGTHQYMSEGKTVTNLGHNWPVTSDFSTSAMMASGRCGGDKEKSVTLRDNLYENSFTFHIRLQHQQQANQHHQYNNNSSGILGEVSSRVQDSKTVITGRNETLVTCGNITAGIETSKILKEFNVNTRIENPFRAMISTVVTETPCETLKETKPMKIDTSGDGLGKKGLDLPARIENSKSPLHSKPAVVNSTSPISKMCDAKNSAVMKVVKKEDFRPISAINLLMSTPKAKTQVGCIPGSKETTTPIKAQFNTTRAPEISEVKTTVAVPEAQGKKEDEQEVPKKNVVIIDGEEFQTEHEILETNHPSLKHDYLIGKHLGSGAYATVRLAYQKSLQRKVAIKTYDKAKMATPNKRKTIENEVAIMKRVNHDNIVKFLDYIETSAYIHIVMEYVEGISMYHCLKSKANRRLTEPEMRTYFRQIVSAVNYCHLMGITHRDIKLENIICAKETGKVKLIDFGFSTRGPPSYRSKTFCGTPSYMAPEIIARKEYRGPPVDIWALGILLFAFCCGAFPFRGQNDTTLYEAISKASLVIPDFVPTPQAEIIRRCLEVDPENRPAAADLLDHMWLQQSKSVSRPRVTTRGTRGGGSFGLKGHETESNTSRKMASQQSHKKLWIISRKKASANNGASETNTSAGIHTPHTAKSNNASKVASMGSHNNIMIVGGVKSNQQVPPRAFRIDENDHGGIKTPLREKKTPEIKVLTLASSPNMKKDEVCRDVSSSAMKSKISLLKVTKDILRSNTKRKGTTTPLDTSVE